MGLSQCNLIWTSLLISHKWNCSIMVCWNKSQVFYLYYVRFFNFFAIYNCFFKIYKNWEFLLLNPDKDPLQVIKLYNQKLYYWWNFLKRFFKGTQSYLNFYLKTYRFLFLLFQKNFGFVSFCSFIIIYAIIIYRIVAIGAISRSDFFKIFVIVLVAIFVFITINMSMVLGYYYCGLSINYVIRWLINACNYDWIWNSYEC